MFYANVRRANAEFSILAYLQKNVEDSFFFWRGTNYWGGQELIRSFGTTNLWNHPKRPIEHSNWFWFQHIGFVCKPLDSDWAGMFPQAYPGASVSEIIVFKTQHRNLHLFNHIRTDRNWFVFLNSIPVLEKMWTKVKWKWDYINHISPDKNFRSMSVATNFWFTCTNYSNCMQIKLNALVIRSMKSNQPVPSEE